MATPFIYPFRDGLGVERFRVEFICESSAEAVAVAERGRSAPVAAAFASVLNQATSVPDLEQGDEPPAETAGDFLATRQHDLADGDTNPCIGSVCGVGE